MRMEQISINQIKNGFTVYQAYTGTVYWKNKEEVIESIKTMLDLAKEDYDKI